MQELYDLPPIPVATAVLSVLLAAVLYWIKNRGLPPGPTGLPFLGYYPFLAEKSYHLQLQKLAQKYGDVFSFNATGQLYIHLNTSKVLREAHVTRAESFASRMTSYNLMKYCFEKGVIFENGERWRVLRKFFVQSLKGYGVSSLKGELGGSVEDSLAAIVEQLHELQGAPFDATTLLTSRCTSTMKQLVFSEVPIEQHDLQQLMKAYESLLSPLEGKQILLAGSVAEHLIVPFSSRYRNMVTNKMIMDYILLKIIKTHELSLDKNHPRDIIDCYILERIARIKKNDITAEYFTDEALVGSLIQLVGDGALGVGFFIANFLDFLTKHPDVQQKVRDEVMEVVGPDRLPTGEDRGRLPYTNAAILEMIRLSEFFPTFPSLQCTSETTLGGHKIPVGSVTLVNHWAIHHDHRVYKDPYTFDPERFIAKPGKPKEELPVLFGVGKRACAGESFVMSQAFLFLVTIVQKFRMISAPPEDNTRNYFGLRMCAQPIRA